VTRALLGGLVATALVCGCREAGSRAPSRLDSGAHRTGVDGGGGRRTEDAARPARPKRSDAAPPASASKPPPPPAEPEPAPGDFEEIGAPDYPDLFALVLWQGELRNAAEKALLAHLGQKEPRAAYTTGYPLVVQRKDLPLVKDGRGRFYVVAGYCSGPEAKVVAAGVEGELLHLRRGTGACPALAPAGTARALAWAMKKGDLQTALRLADNPMSEGARMFAAKAAAHACSAKLLEKLVGPGVEDVNALMGEVVSCEPASETASPPDVLGMAELLLGRGARAKENSSWLVGAVESGRLEVAKRLVAAGADPLSESSDLLRRAAGQPPIMAWVLSFHPKLDQDFIGPVVHKEDVESLRLLLAAGASIHPGAAGTGLNELDLLLLHFRAPPTPLLLALLDGRPAFRAAFDGDRSRLSALPPAAWAETWGGWTPLAVAALAGRDEVGQWLLDQVVPSNVVVGNPEKKWSFDLLSLAVMGRATGLAKRLIAAKAQPDAVTSECCRAKPTKELVSPVAIKTPKLKAPWQAMRTPQEWFDEWSMRESGVLRLRPLHRAAWTGQVEVVEALLAAGVDPNQADDSGQKLTPAMLAALGGHSDVLKALARAKANLAAADAQSFSPLAYAFASPEPVQVMNDLLAVGGKKLAVSSRGALVAAAAAKQAKAVERLLALGAGEGREGTRAAHMLCRSGDEDGYKLLVEKGGEIAPETCLWDEPDEGD
jgi:hypothetical protein